MCLDVLDARAQRAGGALYDSVVDEIPAQSPGEASGNLTPAAAILARDRYGAYPTLSALGSNICIHEWFLLW